MHDAFLALVKKAMLVTVYTLGEDGEIDKERAINWLDNHEIQVMEENGACTVEISKIEEESEADGSSR